MTGAPPSWPHLYLLTSQRTPDTIMPGGLGPQPVNPGGTQTSHQPIRGRLACHSKNKADPSRLHPSHVLCSHSEARAAKGRGLMPSGDRGGASALRV